MTDNIEDVRTGYGDDRRLTDAEYEVERARLLTEVSPRRVWRPKVCYQQAVAGQPSRWHHTANCMHVQATFEDALYGGWLDRGW